MNIAHIRQIIGWMTEAGLTHLELNQPSCSLRLHSEPTRTTPLPAPRATPQEEEAATTYVTATGVGEFQPVHPLRAAPEAEEGTFVEAGSLVGYLRVGLLYQPLYATSTGRISEPLVPSGQPVDYSTPLFALHTAT